MKKLALTLFINCFLFVCLSAQQAVEDMQSEQAQAYVKLEVRNLKGQVANMEGDKWLLLPMTTYNLYVISSDCSLSQYEWILPPSLTRDYVDKNMICVTSNSRPVGSISVNAKSSCDDRSKVRILQVFFGKDNSGENNRRFDPDISSRY